MFIHFISIFQVFEGSGEEAYHHPDSSSAGSMCSTTASPKSKNQTNKKGHSSKLSDATSERCNAQMSSFSRCATPSPVPHSGQATPTNQVIYSEYLGANHNNHRMNKSTRLTVDYVQSIDPAIGPNATVVTPKLVASTSVAPKSVSKTSVPNSNGPPSISSQQDDSQYASMLAELEQSLIEKKIQVTNMSPDDTSLTASTDKFGSSKSSSKDLEFSKELEAALQLIQDLETPSEGPADGTQLTHSTKVARSESEKTLSAAVSLPSPEQGPYKLQTPEVQTPQNGKHDEYRRTNVIHIEPSSQSTSGYSSPNSFSSNIRLSHASSGISNSTIHDNIYTGDQTNVVRIYIEQNSPCNTPTPGDTNIDKIPSNPKLHTKDQTNRIDNTRQSPDSLGKSYIPFKKRSKLVPQPDFQNRIFKSECLAYLTDEELVARHKCNRDVIRVRDSISIFYSSLTTVKSFVY